MATEDVQSFVRKFLLLWSSGRNASLTLNSMDGKACINMQLELGAYQPCENGAYVQSNTKNFSPSRLRRRDRRLQDRNAAEKVVITDNVINSPELQLKNEVGETIASNVDISEDNDQVMVDLGSNCTMSCVEKEFSFNETKSEDNIEVNDLLNVGDDENQTESETGPFEVTKKNTEAITTEEVGVNDVESTFLDIEDAADTNKSNEKIAADDPKHSVSSEYLVYAKVNFHDSPEEGLTKTDLKHLDGILYRKDHLKTNLIKIEYGKYSTRNSDDGRRFDHTLDLKITVEASRLWENPRSYVWRHFGQYEWKQHNGSLITMNRIHMKS